MSTLTLVLLVDCAKLESIADAHGSVIVVTQGEVPEARARCVANEWAYLPLRSLLAGIVCAYMLPFDYVDIVLVGEGDVRVQGTFSERFQLCCDGLAVCAVGADVKVECDAYETLQRRVRDSSYIYCDALAHGSNCMTVAREWLRHYLKHLKPCDDPNSILVDLQQRLLQRCVARERGRPIPAPKSATCICIFAFNRPHYFQKLVQSLAKQITKEDVVLFLDSPECKFKGRICDPALVHENVTSIQAAIPFARVCQARQNLCVAQNQYFGMLAVFGTAKYDRALFLEDDLVLGAQALKSVHTMWHHLELMHNVIAFNLGYRDYSERQTLRLVEPYPSEDDVKDGCRKIHDHTHYWAWATTRLKYERMQREYRHFYITYFKGVQYDKRNVHGIIADIRKRGIYTQHGSQDWTRHACFRLNGMHLHLVPSRRLIVPIGVEGYHCNEQIFKHRLGLDNTVHKVYNAAISICTPIHIFRSIGVHPAVLQRHPWVTQLGYPRWTRLDSTPIILIPSDAVDEHPHAIRVADSDTLDTRPWARFISACIRRRKFYALEVQ